MNFAARNELLQAMGYATYVAYLNSPLWKSIRARVYESKGRTCLRCKAAPATAIHHTDYDQATLRGDSLICLVPICDPCHCVEHGIQPDGSYKKSDAAPRRVKRKAKAGKRCRCGVLCAKHDLCRKCRDKLGLKTRRLPRQKKIDPQFLAKVADRDARLAEYREKLKATAEPPPIQFMRPIRPRPRFTYACPCGNARSKNAERCKACQRLLDGAAREARRKKSKRRG